MTCYLLIFRKQATVKWQILITKIAAHKIQDCLVKANVFKTDHKMVHAQFRFTIKYLKFKDSLRSIVHIYDV